MKSPRVYLAHILDCLTEIDSISAGGRERVLESTVLQAALLRNLQVLCESSQHLPETMKIAHPEMDWRSMSALRNILVHDYFGIDITRILRIVETELPHLRATVQAMLGELQ